MDRGEDQRRLSRDRLRAGYLTQSVRQIREMALLLDSGDASIRDAVAHELERMSDTAPSFGLEEVREGARQAALGVLAGRGRDALAPAAFAVRRAGGATRFPPLVIVAKDPLLARLQVEAARCCEPVQLYETVAQSRDPLRCEDPQAMVVPYDALPDLDDVDRRQVVFVYGASQPGEDFEQRLDAAVQGAAGFLPERFDLRGLLERVRQKTWQSRAAVPRVLVAHDDAERREAIRAAVDSEGVAATGTGTGEGGLLALLGESWPELLVLGEVCGTVACSTLVRVLRGHHRFVDLPIVAVVPAAAGLAVLEAGADNVVDDELPAEVIGARVRAILQRVRERNIGRDPVTGLRDRGSMLRALDRGISEVRRGGKVLSFAIVEIEGAETYRRSGRAGYEYAVRVLGRAIESAIRASDVVGRVGADSFGVLFPACGSDQARRRLEDIRTLYAALCTRDERLAGITFSAGVADTEDGVDRLVLRAEEALERARARDARGAVGL